MSLTSILKLGGFLVFLIGMFFVIRSLDFSLYLKPDRIVNYLENLGPFAPVIFIATMAIAVVISPIPSLPLDFAAGIAFGPFLGTLYAVAGAELGAIGSFLIGRALGREGVSKLLGVNAVFCEKCTDRHLAVLVLISRLFPIFSFDLISYGAGLTGMSLKWFALATLFGMIPPTFALTYYGKSVVMAEWPVILLGGLFVTLFLLLPKLIKSHRSSWWAKLLQGEPGERDLEIERKNSQAPTANTAGQTCPLCGGPKG